MGHRYEVLYFWGDGWDFEKCPERWEWHTAWTGDSLIKAVWHFCRWMRAGYPRVQILFH